MDLVVLPSNRPAHRFYRGGQRITALRGEPDAGSHEPEDWVASVTAVAGEAPQGLTALPDGRLLRDAVEADPVAWLGDAHVAAYGADTRLLVKLLDAGQRLPVHAHPDDVFSARELGRAHGKAEAWWILEGGSVHLGLRETVSPADLRALVEGQDTERLLALLHRRDVAPGDVVFVPPGVLHAIGEGVLLLEVQEPEDLSILLEWRGFAIDGAKDGHLGLGLDRALDAVETTARTGSDVDGLVHRASAGRPLPDAADPYFRLERREARGGAELAAGFAVVLVVSGDVVLRPATGRDARCARGATVLVPHGAGVVRLEGRGDVLIARPPAP
ncbi:class I mannose-6-phosphate isomerase [Microbacterium betulae]|uniref:Class I mannose-6-phosphate isomerase n=1 Tax=Microbacterium betulae TaxID=2981139 RepID=A0AA97FEE3_9MICO|nr:class I mannose-6-phosphate isomerase [Microbacterium sp. AB]WOF22061.1 class I mannose-6-phosphate isomerase [Microbacterium sp. AB]